MTLDLKFSTDRERKIVVATAIKVRNLRQERKRHSESGGLIHYIRYFWHVLEPNTPFIDGWALFAMCKHLEAVARGEIDRLLINVPPGSMKSLLCNVFFPTWQWAAFKRGDLRFLAFSYSSDLTERDNEKLIHLMSTNEFIEMYGSDVWLSSKGVKKPSNNKRGWKLASSSGGVGTGERANGILYDDPHNVKDGESKVVTESTVKFFRESMSDRLNDLTKSFIIVIMQRVSEGDVSGCIIKNDFNYVHLCIPAEYDPSRHCTTYVNGKQFWTDPRTKEGELYWPERFPREEMERLKKIKGQYAWAGQYQQNPEIRGGGIFRREYWKSWGTQSDIETGKYDKDDFDFIAPGNKWPKFDYILASLDPAFTAKQSNDPSALTIWGCFSHEGESCAMLIHAWRKWLPLHGPTVERGQYETDEDYRLRAQQQWGLVETVGEDCRRFKVAKLLIENKASGHDVSVEMHRLFTGYTNFEFVDPHGLDKLARAIRVQPEFSNGQIWARTHKKYAAMVVDEMAIFDKGKYDDLVDSTSAAVWYLRNAGFLKRKAEKQRALINAAKVYKQESPLYEC
jgi:predicted phage terminase large subunit-like protein